METLSTVANVGGVVGLAEVALKLTATLIDLIRRASSASRKISELYSQIQGLASVLVEVHIWAEEYQRSPFVEQDGQRVSLNLEEALKKCKEQLINLASTLENQKRPKGGLFGQWKAHVGFALSEPQAHHATQMIVHHHNTLKMLLQVRENRDLIVLRKEIGYLRLTVHDAESRIMASTNALDRRVSRHLPLQAPSQAITTQSRSSYAIESPPSGSTGARRVLSSMGPVPTTYDDQVSSGGQYDIPTFKRTFKDWNIAKSRPTTATAYALAAFGTESSGARRDTMGTLLTRFPLSRITLPLMLVEQPLLTKIIDIAKNDLSRSEGCPEALENTRTHACVSCVGSDTLWIISSIRLLLQRAHMASATSKPLTHADVIKLELPPVTAPTHAIKRPPHEAFHHQSTLKTSSGTLLLQWRIAKRRRSYEDNVMSFAFFSHVQLDAAASGLFGTLAKVRPFEPCVLYIQPNFDVRRLGGHIDAGDRKLHNHGEESVQVKRPRARHNEVHTPRLIRGTFSRRKSLAKRK